MIDEEYGVFVSPDGDDDSGDGSRANPYATIAKGIEEAAASEKRVYACADGGVYDESVTIDDAASGLEMFGGFSCDDWSYSETAKSRVASPTALALHIDGVTGVRIEDFAFEAADATMPGESSIGAFVANATNIVFRRLKIEAGLGMNGANSSREDFAFPNRASLDGNDASGGTGAMPKVCDCQGGTQSIGGVGGTVPNQGGGTGAPDHAGPGGEGGTSGLTCVEGVGRNGANAPSARPALGAATRGILAESGWIATAGTDAVHGPPGQGGGGGASALLVTAGGGGGGGCGGCGGAGGKGGQGGGASIAVVSFESTVVIEDSELTARDAGAGGDGIGGQLGQMESGFGGDGAIGACDGGAGGFGGKGGASGGGAGGISVGILWSGDNAPTVNDDTMLSFGIAGSGGTGGEVGVNDGVAGVADEVLEVP